jgi:hypothetical protein
VVLRVVMPMVCVLLLLLLLVTDRTRSWLRLLLSRLLFLVATAAAALGAAAAGRLARLCRTPRHNHVTVGVVQRRRQSAVERTPGVEARQENATTLVLRLLPIVGGSCDTGAIGPSAAQYARLRRPTKLLRLRQMVLLVVRA